MGRMPTSAEEAGPGLWGLLLSQSSPSGLDFMCFPFLWPKIVVSGLGASNCMACSYTNAYLLPHGRNQTPDNMPFGAEITAFSLVTLFSLTVRRGNAMIIGRGQTHLCSWPSLLDTGRWGGRELQMWVQSLVKVLLKIQFGLHNVSKNDLWLVLPSTP